MIANNKLISFNKHSDGTYRIQSPFPDLTVGVAAKSANQVDYGMDPDTVRAAEKKLLEKITGVETKNIAALEQLHEDAILFIQEAPRQDILIYGEADGLATALSGVCIVIRSADCVPVFAYDRKRRVIGAAHSGWRGAGIGVARTLVREMRRAYGSSGGDLSAFILPSAGPASYVVGPDVAVLFPEDVRKKNGALYLDLWKNIERSLAAEGVPEENIFNARICTIESRNEFFSHRGGDRGRNLNFGLLTF